METNRLHPSDNVEVEMYLPSSGSTPVHTCIAKGFHSVENAAQEAWNSLPSPRQPKEMYVYRITNLSTGTTSRYRFNAHGNLRLIAEAGND